MNLGEFLNKQAVTAGVSQDDAAFKAFLTNPEISKIDLPDDVANKINATFMTVDQAKNNGTLKNHFTAMVLDPVDKELQSVYDAFEGLPDEIKTKLQTEKSTYNKIKILPEAMKALHDLELKKVGAVGGEKAKLVEEIDKLNKLILQGKAEADKILNDVKNASATEIQEFALESQLRGYTYGTGLEDDINLITAKTLLNKNLTEKKARLTYNKDTRSFELKNAEHPDLPYIENNQPVDFKTFTDKVVAPLIKVSIAPVPVAPLPLTPFGQTGAPLKNSIAKAQTSRALADIQQNGQG